MRWIIVLLMALLPLQAAAQAVATLVADNVSVVDRNQLTANGNVEVFFDGTRLSARQITYDQANDRLTILGPIYLEGEDGTIITAERADLDPQLENGMLRGARLVLEQQLQLAANQIDRVDGRFSQLHRVAASSCNVCGNRPALWDIRAERVVHDQAAKQLYFEDAVFRVRGTPIFWLPYARLPDPTLIRTTGLLIPRIRTSDLLGTGIKLPYFITLGDHRDITLTPYVSPNTRTLEAVYRQAFLRGDIMVRGAFSDDTLQEDRRSYLFAEGQFEVAQNTTLSFDLRTVSDTAYLTEYGFADVDRLESTISAENITANRFVRARLSYFETLRDDETNASLPPIVADLRYEQLATLGGGYLTYGGSADAVIRTGTDGGDTGRDLGRVGAFADWSRPIDLPQGLRASVRSGARIDAYRVSNDSGFATMLGRVVPHVGATLSWPLAKATRKATHLLTPTVALAWSDIYGDDNPPNEDSTRAELDQANLLSLSRFPGDDRVETGARAAAGLTYSRSARAGSFTTFTLGRIWRDTEAVAFSPSSGLDGRRSDWLIAGQITSPLGVYFDARLLIDDDVVTTLGAGRLGWRTDTVDLTAAYIWQAADPTEARPNSVSEWTFDTTVALSDAFTITADARYDVANDQPARAGLGLEWRNECVTVDLSVSRRFTSSTTVDPSTDYGLSVSLSGFSAGRSQTGPVAGCTN